MTAVPIHSIADAARVLLASGMKPTVPDVLPLARAYYAKLGNGAGGSLHIVLDDGNVTDGDVEFCEERARERDDEDGVALAQVLRRMSKTQRAKITRMT